MTISKARAADLRRLLAQTARLPVPCRAAPALWLSDDPADQAVAADACLLCPALHACRAYATRWCETGGTWGGRVSRGGGGQPTRQALTSPTGEPRARCRCSNPVTDPKEI